MVSKRVMTGVVLLAAVAAVPVFAEDGQRRRSGSDRRGDQTTEETRSGGDRGRDRAVARSRDDGRQNDVRQNEVRQNEVRQNEVRQNEVRRQNDARRQDEARQQSAARDQAGRQREAQRQFDARRNGDGRRDYDRRDYQRPYYSNRGGYGSRTIIVPRIIRPSIVTIVPYRPYVYRPRIGLGIYYGAGGSYPYGYTPRGYYDPLPGRPYGGVRITGAPREARVFSDGYYVGIVDDFDGLFQHVNLEAGPHHIEIEEPGLEPIAFDIIVQPGRTTTFRADIYPY